MTVDYNLLLVKSKMVDSDKSENSELKIIWMQTIR